MIDCWPEMDSFLRPDTEDNMPGYPDVKRCVPVVLMNKYSITCL